MRLLAVSQLLLLVILLLRSERHLTGGLFALTAIAFMAYLLIPLSRSYFFSGTLHELLVILATSIPALLWLAARRFFSDAGNIPWPFWCWWCLYMVLWLPEWRAQGWPPAVANGLFYLAPQLIKLAFVAHVIYLALAEREADLVEARSNLRVPLALAASALTAGVIIVEIWLAGPSPLALEVFGACIMFGFTLGLNMYLFHPRPELQLRAPEPDAQQSDAPQSTGPGSAEHVDLARITAHAETARAYAEHGLTLGQFATALELPEYRVRRLINQQLKYKNFNQFLNFYRIREASQRLLEEPQLPILTIALDVGFKSVSSFNTAFKSRYGCTPSEYRRDTHQQIS